MDAQRVRIGELLVAAHIITSQQLEEVLEAQKDDSRRLGKLLVEAGLVTETQVTQILSQQLSVPWVSLYHIEFSRQLLDLVPSELAEKYGVVPIFVRRVRGLGETLYIAMDDPSDETARAEVSQWCGLPVRTMIAPPSDIRAAIRVYYSGGKDSATLAEGIAELDAEEAKRQRPSMPAPPPPVQRPSARSPGRHKRRLELTLLDGTHLKLPSARADGSSEGSALTAHDLVTLLRALSPGAVASELATDEVQWESVFSALLELLLKKQLIAGYEFVEPNQG